VPAMASRKFCKVVVVSFTMMFSLLGNKSKTQVIVRQRNTCHFDHESLGRCN
jgi:hypothetical protein